jgi:hypothetical protein
MTTSMKKTKASKSAKPPVAKLRLGLINASIWERATSNGTFHSVSFERRYRDAKGEWHSAQSFNLVDLLVLAKLADEAHTEIMKLRARANDEASA